MKKIIIVMILLTNLALNAEPSKSFLCGLVAKNGQTCDDIFIAKVFLPFTQKTIYKAKILVGNDFKLVTIDEQGNSVAPFGSGYVIGKKCFYNQGCDNNTYQISNVSFNEGTAYDYLDIAYFNDGYLAATWYGGDNHVYARVFYPDMTPIGNAIQVSDFTGNNEMNSYPRIVVFDGNEHKFAVIWTRRRDAQAAIDIYNRLYKISNSSYISLGYENLSDDYDDWVYISFKSPGAVSDFTDKLKISWYIESASSSHDNELVFCDKPLFGSTSSPTKIQYSDKAIEHASIGFSQCCNVSGKFPNIIHVWSADHQDNSRLGHDYVIYGRIMPW